jgi:serine/threonine protein kinase
MSTSKGKTNYSNVFLRYIYYFINSRGKEEERGIITKEALPHNVENAETCDFITKVDINNLNLNHKMHFFDMENRTCISDREYSKIYYTKFVENGNVRHVALKVFDGNSMPHCKKANCYCQRSRLKYHEAAQHEINMHAHACDTVGESIKYTIGQKLQKQHKHVTKMLGYWYANEQYTMVTEFAHSGTVFDRLVDEKHFSLRNAAAYLADVIGGLRYLHSLKIVHLNLDSDNLLMYCDDKHGLSFQPRGASSKVGLTADNDQHQEQQQQQQRSATSSVTVKIADFGESVFGPDGTCLPPVSNTRQVQYLAPEIFNFFTYSYASDMWALGILLFEFLHGYPPFFHNNYEESIECIKHSKYYSPTTDDSDEYSHTLIKNLLKLSPTERPLLEDLMKHSFFLKFLS